MQAKNVSSLEAFPSSHKLYGRYALRVTIKKQASLQHREHCTKNPIYVFPEMKLHGLVPSSYNNVPVSNLYIPQDWSAYLAATK